MLLTAPVTASDRLEADGVRKCLCLCQKFRAVVRRGSFNESPLAMESGS